MTKYLIDYMGDCILTLSKLRAQISLYAYVLTPTVHLSALETQQSKEVPVYVSSVSRVSTTSTLPLSSLVASFSDRTIGFPS
jgi:hypothetical protein